MNINELIEQLKNYPPDMRVILDGYEGGYADVISLHKKEIYLNVNSDIATWYYGSHEGASDNKNGDETALVVSPNEAIEEDDNWVRP
jgi:hypothetical protein